MGGPRIQTSEVLTTSEVCALPLFPEKARREVLERITPGLPLVGGAGGLEGDVADAGAGLARALESAYRAMWRAWCEGIAAAAPSP